MVTSAHSSMIKFAAHLRALRNQQLATQLLWLAAEGRLELLSDGSIGFWSDDPAVLELSVKVGTRVSLRSSLVVDPSWSGPQEEAAIWGAVTPQSIEAVEFDSRGCPRLTLREFTLKLRVEADEEAAMEARPRRKGPARLYPRLARVRAV